MASYTLERRLPVAVERTFDVVVAEDVLPHVLHRWGPVPAVVGTADITGAWDTPGSERTVLLGDGSSAKETVLAWERPSHFRYRVDRFSGPVARLADHAIGEWWLSREGTGSAFRWTYTFFGRGPGSRAVLSVVARTAWGRYMEQCADLCVARALSDAAAD